MQPLCLRLAEPAVVIEPQHQSELETALEWQCRMSKLPKPVPQYVCVPDRRWRFDLAWPEKLLAVEVQGGIWTAGAHARGKGIERDCEKISTAVAHGWRVMVVSAAMIYDGSAALLIEKALA